MASVAKWALAGTRRIDNTVGALLLAVDDDKELEIYSCSVIRTVFNQVGGPEAPAGTGSSSTPLSRPQGRHGLRIERVSVGPAGGIG
jgi:hypothetical protein